ncbi:MAG: O-antigen polymerase [Acidobacteriota bacterium]
MNRLETGIPRIQHNTDKALLIPVIGLAIMIIVGIVLMLVLLDDQSNPFKDTYLLPWVILLGVVIAVPNFYLIYKGRFNLFNPIVYAAWSYFVPSFFLGGLILASGLSQPFFLVFVEDERYNLPLTLVYAALGYGGLALGFLLPFGKKIGSIIDVRLPKWDWKPENVFLPGILLLIIGVGNSIIAFGQGILGYQKVDEVGAYDGLIFLLTLFWLEASFLLWISIFKVKQLNVNHFLIIVLLMATALTKSVFQGNRGSLFQVFILIAFAFMFSGRKIQTRHRVYGAILLVLAIVIGMIYGTAFRNVKQSEDRVSFDEYGDLIGTTFDKLFEQDLIDNLQEGVSALTERIEGVSSLAVVVSNYEKLEPYEESYGLKNNIINDSLYFFIPRPLWQNKPVGSEPRKYADLYFNFSENSFTITPMGDLLRNFGPIGVPLGMLLLGFILRIVSASLVENGDYSIWRVTLYYMLIIGISYEGFYGTIIPYLVKYGLVAVIGVLFIWLFQIRINSPRSIV